MITIGSSAMLLLLLLLSTKAKTTRSVLFSRAFQNKGLEMNDMMKSMIELETSITKLQGELQDALNRIDVLETVVSQHHDEIINLGGTLASNITMIPPPNTTATGNNTIASNVAADNALAILEDALDAVNATLVNSIINDLFIEDPTNPLTLLAPIDDAFGEAIQLSDVSGNYLNKLVTDTGFILHLENFLLYHVVSGSELRESDLTNGLVVTMANNENITITLQNGNVFFSDNFSGGITILDPDVSSVNGIVQKLDLVLLPLFMDLNLFEYSTNAANGFSIFAELVVLAGLETTLSTAGADRTLLVPDDDAFNALQAGDLAYLRDTANVADLQALLLFHVIDTVLPTVQITNNTSYNTDNGQTLDAVIENSHYYFDNVLVLETDAIVANGILHTLQSVLIPSDVILG